MQDATTTRLAAALHRHYARNQRWGFLWALWLAIEAPRLTPPDEPGEPIEGPPPAEAAPVGG